MHVISGPRVVNVCLEDTCCWVLYFLPAFGHCALVVTVGKSMVNLNQLGDETFQVDPYRVSTSRRNAANVHSKCGSKGLLSSTLSLSLGRMLNRRVGLHLSA